MSFNMRRGKHLDSNCTHCPDVQSLYKTVWWQPADIALTGTASWPLDCALTRRMLTRSTRYISTDSPVSDIEPVLTERNWEGI